MYRLASVFHMPPEVQGEQAGQDLDWLLAIHDVHLEAERDVQEREERKAKR